MRQLLKIIVIFFILITTISDSFSQNKKGIKLYQNTDFFETQYSASSGNAVTPENNTNFGRFSLALAVIMENGFTHEIEVFIPEFSKAASDVKFPFNYMFSDDNNFDHEVSSYSMRYELSRNLVKQSGRLGASLGVALNPYLLVQESIPNVTTSYYGRKNYFGASFNLTARMQYQLTNRLAMDLNIPLKIYDMRWERFKIENPHIPPDQQVRKEFDGEFFDDVYTIRLGLMYVISK